ncbi:MAG TPA: hypothetical protein VKC63_07310 [Solirubrobacterales bacterium]|nr:hypothetical protein [Solirubrobacterales bacterium]
MRFAALAASIAAIFAIAPAASGETTHTYPVTLTISVDRAAHQISGAILTDAPSEFCDTSAVRIRQAMPGHDRVVARLFPEASEWRMKSPPALHGARVYAEVLTYHLPQRPVECLGARSRTVTAP